MRPNPPLLILKSIVLHPFPRGIAKCSWLLLLFSCVSYSGRDLSEENASRAVLLTQMSLVKGFLDKGQTSDAWANVRELYRNHPENPDVLNLVGLTHLALENKKNAIQLFAKAYRLKPKPSYGLNLSSAYITLGQNRKARKIIIKILKSKQKYDYRERLWHNLALTLEKENSLKKARKFYLKATRINPNFLLSLLHLGQVNKKMGRRVDAMRAYRMAMKVCSSCFEPINEISTYLLKQGNSRGAAKLLKNYLRQKPENERAIQSARRLLNLARNLQLRQANKTRSR